MLPQSGGSCTLAAMGSGMSSLFPVCTSCSDPPHRLEKKVGHQGRVATWDDAMEAGSLQGCHSHLGAEGSAGLRNPKASPRDLTESCKEVPLLLKTGNHDSGHDQVTQANQGIRFVLFFCLGLEWPHCSVVTG